MSGAERDRDSSVVHPTGGAGSTGSGAFTRTDAIWALGLFVGALALRLVAIGRSPYAVDEYYFARAVGFVLEHGWPEFPGGSAYLRGILLQYAMAVPAAMFGATEGVLRLIPALAGAGTVALLFVAARRAVGRTAAVICAALLALSSWHFEFSRFIRMYSAFQGLFLLFVYGAYRGFVDGDRRWKVVAWASAAAAPLLHESGPLLPVMCGMLAVRSGIAVRERVALVAGSLAAFVPGVAMYKISLAALRSSRDIATAGSGRSALRMPETANLEALTGGIGLVAAGLSVAIVAACAWRIFRACGPWERLGVAVVAVLVLAQQYGVAFWGVLLLALLNEGVARGLRARIVPWGTLFTGPAVLSIGASVRSASSLEDWITGAVLYPDVHEAVLYPYLETVPVWLAVAGLGLAVVAARALFAGRFSFASWVAAAAVLGIVFVSTVNTRYTSTRYTFFIQPLLLLAAFLAVAPRAGVFEAARGSAGSRPVSRRGLALAAVVAVGFLVSGDYDPRHLARPGGDDAMYRQGVFEGRGAHWFSRADYRGAGEWVEAHRAPGDVVVIGATAARAYVSEPYVAYVRRTSGRWEIVARHDGRELWTGAELVGEPHEIAAKIPEDPASTVWVVTPLSDVMEGSDLTEEVVRATAESVGATATLEHVSSDGRIGVLGLRRDAASVW